MFRHAPSWYDCSFSITCLELIACETILKKNNFFCKFCSLFKIDFFNVFRLFWCVGVKNKS
jgi:hypothetical protein